MIILITNTVVATYVGEWETENISSYIGNVGQGWSNGLLVELDILWGVQDGPHRRSLQTVEERVN